MWGKLLVAAVALVTAAVFYLYLRDPYSSTPSQTESSAEHSGGITDSSQPSTLTNESGGSASGGSPDSNNPFASDPSNSEDDDAQSSRVPTDTASTSAGSEGADTNRIDSTVGLAEIAGVSIYEVGRENWASDEQFLAMQQELRENPALLDALLNEIRYESDPARLKRLTHLLGKLDPDRLTAAARDMLYSGNPDAQLAALDLLRQTQGNNSEARDMLVDMISVEQDARVLNVALNALATPGSSSTDQRAGIVTNVSSLVSHSDANVRARSYGLLAAWADTDNSTSVIVGGLSDPDPRVRGKVAHSLLGYRFPNDNVRQELIRVAENSDEVRSTRQAALHALGRMSLSDDDRSRLRRANEEVSRSPHAR